MLLHNFTARSTSFQSRLALTHSSPRSHTFFLLRFGFLQSSPFNTYHNPPLNIMASLAPRLSSDALTDDLLELGFNEKLVRRFAEAPYHVGYAKDLLKSYIPASHKARRGGHINLSLHKGSRNRHWAVYDPSKHDPLLDCDNLKLTVKFAIYQSGNPRFLEYNTRTNSLRLRSSRILVGQQIKYTDNGPILAPLDESDSDSEATIEIKQESEETTKPVWTQDYPSSDSELSQFDSE
ncbi:hypothetical protein D6D01_07522 [Aureobasidium pullulans]|uniref:Uncharacterized protein n=1 Tax=Aureobasidium pullulans TaxID=5580 RepID=A0A4V4JTH4_AURPU|nr:hypothetical protein D6D01_07522 [Aureobasidium pullulans]